MNHYCARQRQKDGRWDCTSANGRVVARPVGYCAGWMEVDDYPESLRTNNVTRQTLKLSIEELRPFKDKFHKDGHATEEEAYACYREFLLDLCLKLRPQSAMGIQHSSRYRCKANGCDEFTAGYAELNARIWPLCDAHCTRETVEQLMPTIGEVWSSY